ncbi:MAG: phosphoenolpyruvate--protein phosphotransferase [Ignavibacteriales bacterium]|nr:phosphoenolpyruvate--protein phosphotransferase [Ignavibacteriales bacterium]
MKGLKKLLEHSDNVIYGLAAAPGLDIGYAFKYSKEHISVADSNITDVEEAVSNFHDALRQSKKEMLKIFNFAKDKMGEVRAAIFEAQLMILDDPVLIDTIISRINNEKRLPEFIVNHEISKYQQLMILSSESYLQERAMDIEDIKNRIIRNLQKKRWASKIVHDAVVVSENLTPADAILFTKSNAKGYVTDRGGLTSHAAIIARSLDLPAVVGTHNGSQKINDGDLLIVDGFHGLILVNPDSEQLDFFKKKIEHLSKIDTELKGLKDKPAVTTDGREIVLMANVDITGEIDTTITNGSRGVGLFRTEQIIEELGEIPDEEIQIKAYKNLAERIYPDTITIRAFDIGGDKVKQLHMREANPFLGLRGIRFLLANEDLFVSQINSVLKASVNKNIQFMLPMVSTLNEILRSKELIAGCMKTLSKQNIEYDKNIRIGIMVEVPSAALMAREFGKHVDFFSIGTNDLIQFLMAVDRGNDIVSDLYQEFNPAVIRTIHHIVTEGKKSNVSVSMCGEMAADTLATPILVGLGLDCLSVSPSAIPSIKRTIRNLSFESAKSLAEKCLKMSSEKEVTEEVENYFRENNIERTRNII